MVLFEPSVTIVVNIFAMPTESFPFGQVCKKELVILYRITFFSEVDLLLKEGNNFAFLSGAGVD